MNNIDFKDPAVKEMCEVMLRHRQKFVEKRKGADWKAVIFTFAHCFPHDAKSIWEFFKGEATPRKQPPTGGAKITRGPRKKVNASKAGCKDCPDSPAIISSPSNMKINQYIDKSRRQPEPQPKKAEGVFDNRAVMVEKFSDPKKVIEAFEESGPAMIAFAHSEGIDIPGNVARPETIANYISKHFKEQSNADKV